MKKNILVITIILLLNVVGARPEATLFNGLSSKNVIMTKKVQLISSKNIVDIINIAFPTFYALIEKAGFVDALKDAPEITVFVPTDSAFAKMKTFIGNDAYDEIFNRPYEQEGLRKLQRIVKLHIIPSRSTADELLQMQTIQSYGDRKLSITSNNGVMNLDGSSSVIEADIIGTNGIVHVINVVLMP